MNVLPFVLATLVAYLLGSLPTGYLVARLHGNIDLLQQGSKRTGATNVLRTLGRRAAALVVAGDLAKGVVALLAARFITQSDPTADLLAGLAALAGHNYSLFLRFRGGRGVLTGVGTLAVISPPTVLVGAFLACSTIALSRYVSLGSILGACSVPITLLVLVLVLDQPQPHLLYGLAGALFVIASHWDNIGRLLKGTERRLGEKAGH